MGPANPGRGRGGHLHRRLRAPHRRGCIDHLRQELPVFERRVCRMLGQHRSTNRTVLLRAGKTVWQFTFEHLPARQTRVGWITRASWFVRLEQSKVQTPVPELLESGSSLSISIGSFERDILAARVRNQARGALSSSTIFLGSEGTTTPTGSFGPCSRR